MQYLHKKTGEIVTAHQWFKNGDHPDDYVDPVHETEHGHPITYSPEYQQRHDWDGQVVERYVFPAGVDTCPFCKQSTEGHGQTRKKYAQVVCPSDWVVDYPDRRISVQNAYFLSNFSPLEVDV